MRFLLIGLLVLALALWLVASRGSSVELQQQHDVLRGTWIRKDVPGTDPNFYILHSFADGTYTIEGSIPSDDRGEYRVTTVNADGTFEIRLTSSRYGFTVTMDVEPLEDPNQIKLDHQTFTRQEVY